MGFSRKDVQTDGKTFCLFLPAGTMSTRVMSQSITVKPTIFLSGRSLKSGSIWLAIKRSSTILRPIRIKEEHDQNKPVRANYYRAQLFEILATRKNVGAYYKRAEKAEIDETARENLKALGYVDDNGAPVTSPETQHQPKSRWNEGYLADF